MRADFRDEQLTLQESQVSRMKTNIYQFTKNAYSVRAQ